jgi:hypothetical protein
MVTFEGGGELTVSGEECNGRAILPSSSGSADAVNIILRVVGIVIVEHMSDISNILNDRLAKQPMVSLTRRWGPCVVV